VGRRTPGWARRSLTLICSRSWDVRGPYRCATVQLVTQSIECQVSAPYFTNVPKDRITNVWHWVFTGAGTPTVAQYDQLRDIMMGFYEGIFTSTTLAGLAPWVKTTGWTHKYYDMAAPLPRVPVYNTTDTFAGSVAPSSSIPPEVALCVSYQAPATSGVPQARRRGRLFLGGIGAGMTAGTTSTFPVPGTTLIANAAARASICADFTVTTPWQWVIWSRTLGTSADVTDGWVDNAFDTQRRRGQAASARTLWT